MGPPSKEENDYFRFSTTGFIVPFHHNSTKGQQHGKARHIFDNDDVVSVSRAAAAANDNVTSGTFPDEKNENKTTTTTTKPLL